MPTVMDQNTPRTSTELFKDRATRFEATRNEACLSWKESPFGLEPEDKVPDTQQLFALLLDISQSGASIALDRVPRASEGVRLRLEGNDRPDWAEAEVVGVTMTTQGPHLVRLAFRTPCPFETLVAAICG